MSQKQAKGKKKDGKGGECSGRLGENDFWDGFKKEWLERENEKCKVWVSMRVPEGWKGDGVFKCGLCVMKEVVEVKRENEKMKRENDNLKHEVEVLKNEDTKRKDAGIYEKNEDVKTWATIAKRITNEKTIEKLECVEAGMIVKKSDIRKEIEESSIEERRKRRMIVFNLKQSDVKNDKVVVMDMFERMGVRIRSENVSDIIRMRKKEGDETVKPVIVEFKSEYDKWTVLRNKADLREIEEYKSFF